MSFPAISETDCLARAICISDMRPDFDTQRREIASGYHMATKWRRFKGLLLKLVL